MTKNDWILACLVSAAAGYAIALEIVRRQQPQPNPDPLAWLGLWSDQR